VPVAPTESAARVMVMSMRPGAVCCVKVALAPPERMKLPSLTERTRKSDGSNVSVRVTVESRAALMTEIGTVYGPAPTRIAPPGGVTTTWADPRAVAADGAGGGTGGSCGAAAAGGVAGFCAVAGGGGVPGTGVGTNTVPGTGVLPGGVNTVPPAAGSPA
jgi:hypothetical protein